MPEKVVPGPVQENTGIRECAYTRERSMTPAGIRTALRIFVSIPLRVRCL